MEILKTVLVQKSWPRVVTFGLTLGCYVLPFHGSFDELYFNNVVVKIKN